MADWQNWTDQFRTGKYHKTTTGVKGAGMPVIDVDPSDAYASSLGRGMQLSFFHVSSQKAVYFKAFIVAYNETFNSDWVAETVYGRTDPIYMFKGTQRQLSLNFKVPAFSEGEAYENLGRVQKLTQYLYPSYVDSSGGGRIIGQSPLVRMKVMNLAQTNASRLDPAATQQAMAANHRSSAGDHAYDLFNKYLSNGGNQANRGILGVISSVQIDHNLEKEGVLEKGFNTVLPKLIDVSVTFNCIHEHTLGFDQQGNELDPSFPYNVILEQPYDPGAEATTFNQKAAAAEAERNERDVRQQQIDDAQGRYSGLFGTSGPFGTNWALDRLGYGGGRAGRDLRRAQKGKLNEYEAGALAGATLDSTEIEQWTSGKPPPALPGIWD